MTSEFAAKQSEFVKNIVPQLAHDTFSHELFDVFWTPANNVAWHSD